MSKVDIVFGAIIELQIETILQKIYGSTDLELFYKMEEENGIIIDNTNLQLKYYPLIDVIIIGNIQKIELENLMSKIKQPLSLENEISMFIQEYNFPKEKITEYGQYIFSL